MPNVSGAASSQTVETEQIAEAGDRLAQRIAG
jgi:hypothetical protein